MRGRLIIMRHGQSEWTLPQVNRFAGWVDVPLSEQGRRQAERAGQLIKEYGLEPEVVFTSLLGRSIITANLLLDQIDRLWIPVQRTWRLNERHYGAFQGQTRPDMLSKYGEKRFATYRRSYDVAPPALDPSSPYWQGQDPRYGKPWADGLDDLDPASIASESLKDLGQRLEPYWRARIVPLLAQGRTVLVVTHGSVVRSVVKGLEAVSDQDIRSINVPTGVPMVYEFETDQSREPEPVGSGRYLDPDAARKGMAQVEALGKA
ncbi:2,3-bisphosphoglycerate-dependent phosphoglycerate mutase [Bifidobacterium actinocoloniiforme DSM 22766]|uniref:2,3-bisphosphoglycerate-dependent phosphoglycerate mutase n=1 Tax=Bifidobacterium actinocoloniiforme DSM 22766 TaxID=1437605 RepID=A0A086Z0J8_9BIFI|nr:2,3-bisphosphoglycerate-dependent phosphoglycerate mutase [Bifidobacterium actinocoloniiforme]AKV55272.1 phosphoglyceromutase [Bifidobacterium actinocoloniiforme DSM 22766]KFI40048.1 2,3-bisphosphoglycerate-dependent phosphoglycerate mutase [Bifidobacterium actinocoloniiforme DSM 22766]